MTEVDELYGALKPFIEDGDSSEENYPGIYSAVPREFDDQSRLECTVFEQIRAHGSISMDEGVFDDRVPTHDFSSHGIYLKIKP